MEMCFILFPSIENEKWRPIVGTWLSQPGRLAWRHQPDRYIGRKNSQ
jgi:hypothetical protein